MVLAGLQLRWGPLSLAGELAHQPRLLLGWARVSPLPPRGRLRRRRVLGRRRPGPRTPLLGRSPRVLLRPLSASRGRRLGDCTARPLLLRIVITALTPWLWGAPRARTVCSTACVGAPRVVLAHGGGTTTAGIGRRGGGRRARRGSASRAAEGVHRARAHGGVALLLRRDGRRWGWEGRGRDGWVGHCRHRHHGATREWAMLVHWALWGAGGQGQRGRVMHC